MLSKGCVCISCPGVRGGGGGGRYVIIVIPIGLHDFFNCIGIARLIHVTRFIPRRRW